MPVASPDEGAILVVLTAGLRRGGKGTCKVADEERNGGMRGSGGKGKERGARGEGRGRGEA